MKEVVDKIKVAAVRSLTRLTLSALENATLQIEAQGTQFAKAELPPLREESQAIAERFMGNLNEYFDSLTTLKFKDTNVEEYGDMSLVDHDYLEAIIAMEGMVNHARNSDIQQYISFTTRFDSVFQNLHIDETNNPLDPEQIGDSFNEAIRPMRLKAHYLLTIYREFNKAVFHNLEDVLAEANDVLINLGVLPKLDIKARNKELQRVKRASNRPTTDAETRAFSEDELPTPKTSGKSNDEMFAMMQTLVESVAEKKDTDDELVVSAPDQLPADSISADEVVAVQEEPPAQAPAQKPEAVPAKPQSRPREQSALMDMLSTLQTSLDLQAQTQSDIDEAAAGNAAVAQTIRKTLKQQSKQGNLPDLNKESSDVINLVTLLYEAIWKDPSLPIAMKELIGRTQIPIMKIALTDTTFFNDEQHPGRVILNEFAMAGIAWTEIEQLETDPVYSKVRVLVGKFLSNPEADNEFLQGLIDELRAFKSQHGVSDASLEQRIRESDDASERLDDVVEFVSQKINERTHKGDLDPSIRALLDTNIKDFLVKLVLKEGPGGSSWKPVMSTIDVLLWTVQAVKQPGDKARFEKINPRLLDNLGKALEIGGTSKTKITKIMRQLKQVQEFSFHQAATQANVETSSSQGNDVAATAPTPAHRKRREPPPLSRDDPHLRQVDKLPIGIWLEFKGAAGLPVRCTLAAKIDSIDKLFFVNGQGVKMVELTRMRLARELKAGSVKIVSEGSLVDRAMESVISNLRTASPKKAQTA